MANFEKAIKTLEFDRVLEQLAAAAQTEGAKEKAMRIMPQTSLPRIRKLQLNGYPRCHIQILHLLGFEDLQHNNVGIGHRAVIDQIVLTHQRMAFVC